MGELSYTMIKIIEKEIIKEIEKIALPAYIYKVTKQSITIGGEEYYSSKDYYDDPITFSYSTTIDISNNKVVLTGNILNATINKSNYNEINSLIRGKYITGDLIGSGIYGSDDIIKISRIASEGNSKSNYYIQECKISDVLVGYGLSDKNSYQSPVVIDGNTYNYYQTLNG